MTKKEYEVIGSLNMTDQISNEAYDQIMIVAEDEPEECEDCINRQAVFDVIEAYKYLDGNDAIYRLKQWLEDQEPVTPIQKWIPVTERLPEVGSQVLVCFDFKGNRSVYISHFYGDGEFHGLDDEYLTAEGRKYRKAVAWMPLPKADGGDAE